MPWFLNLLLCFFSTSFFRDFPIGIVSLLFSLFPLNLSVPLAQADYLSTFGIKSYQFIRAIHDETTDYHRRRKRSIDADEDEVQRVLTLELDRRFILSYFIFINTRTFSSSEISR